MKIEVGKTYKMRNGEVAEIHSAQPEDSSYYPFSGFMREAEKRARWTSEGHYYRYMDGGQTEHNFDLVEEYVEPATPASLEVVKEHVEPATPAWLEDYLEEYAGLATPAWLEDYFEEYVGPATPAPLEVVKEHVEPAAPTSLQLEVGGYYLTRDGEVVYIESVTKSDSFEFPFEGYFFYTYEDLDEAPLYAWARNGERPSNGFGSKWDLVARTDKPASRDRLSLEVGKKYVADDNSIWTIIGETLTATSEPAEFAALQVDFDDRAISGKIVRVSHKGRLIAFSDKTMLVKEYTPPRTGKVWLHIYQRDDGQLFSTTNEESHGPETFSNLIARTPVNWKEGVFE